MATGGIGFVGVTDKDGKSYQKQFVLAPVSGADVPSEIGVLLTRMGELAAGLATVVKLGVTEWGVRVEGGNIAQAADANARYNETAAIKALLETVGKTGIISIPGADDGIFVGNLPSSDVVDMADTALVAYLADVEAYTLISDGEVIDSFTAGWRVTKAKVSGKPD